VEINAQEISQDEIVVQVFDQAWYKCEDKEKLLKAIQTIARLQDKSHSANFIVQLKIGNKTLLTVVDLAESRKENKSI